jgi:hypothetical protein
MKFRGRYVTHTDDKPVLRLFVSRCVVKGS